MEHAVLYFIVKNCEGFFLTLIIQIYIYLKFQYLDYFNIYNFESAATGMYYKNMQNVSPFNLNL